MKVLVTGSEGYIGTVITRFLSNHGLEVTGLDTGFYRECILYDNDCDVAPVIQKDIRDINHGDLEGIEIIVHLAELSNDPLGQIRPEVTRDINYNGSIKLALMARECGIRKFIYVSSCSVYGIGLEPVVNESSPVNPLTEYAKCKIMTERGLLDMANQVFSPTILRNATVYGPSPRMRFDTVLNNLAGTAWTSGKIIIRSDGTPWRPLIHIHDVCRGIFQVINSKASATDARIYNLGETSENYQIGEIARLVSNVMPDCDIVFEGSDTDSRSYRVSFDEIKEKLDFSCTKTIRDGINELIDLFERISLSESDFSSRGFTRLEQIEHLIKTDRLNAGFYWRGDP